MRYRDILLEYDRGKTLARLGAAVLKKFLNHERNSGVVKALYRRVEKSMSPNDPESHHDDLLEYVMDEIEKNDPSPNKQYVQWMTHRYIDGSIRYLEDLGKANTVLGGFHDMKTKGWFRRNPEHADKADIGQWKNLADLWDFVWHAHNGGVVSNAEKERLAKEKAIKESDILHDGPRFMVVVPNSTAAAKYWGRNTQWCTAAEKDNAFEGYNDIAPLHIVIDKPNNRRWQLWFDENEPQFMDERDEEIDWKEFPEEVWMLFEWPDAAKASIIRTLDARLSADLDTELLDFLPLDDLVAGYFQGSLSAQLHLISIVKERSKEALSRRTPVVHEGQEIGHVYRLGDALALALTDRKSDGFIARYQTSWYSITQAARALRQHAVFFGEIEGKQGRAVMSLANALLEFHTVPAVKSYSIFRPNTVSQDVMTVAQAIRNKSLEMQKA